MQFADEKVSHSPVIDTREETENDSIEINDIELIRKSTTKNSINASWEISHNGASLHCEKEDNCEKTPPFVSIMICTDDRIPGEGSLTDSSTQTEHFLTLSDCRLADVSLSYSKDFNLHESTSNETSEHALRSKRNRADSERDEWSSRPWKKKCTYTASSTSSTSDLAENKEILRASPPSSCQLSSTSEISFKSVNSNHSFKVRKRRIKSASSLRRDVMLKTGQSAYFHRHSYSENSSPG